MNEFTAGSGVVSRGSARSKSSARVERAGVAIPAGRRRTISVGVCLLGDNAKGRVDHARMQQQKTSRHSGGRKSQLCCCECVGLLVPRGSAQSKRLCRNSGVTLPLSQLLCATQITTIKMRLLVFVHREKKKSKHGKAEHT